MTIWQSIIQAIFGADSLLPKVVDVEAILEQRAKGKAEKLNWRTSIVDLLKLLDLDSSPQAREELGREFGYDGAHGPGSAEFNEWLRRRVMRALAQNGGKVPASMLD